MWSEPGIFTGFWATGEPTDAFFGVYGPVKHRFMIDATGMAFDDEWFASHPIFWWSITQTDPPTDMGWALYAQDRLYFVYLQQWLQNRLNEENARRQDLGLGILREEDRMAVNFFNR
jgi:hypothetical protein